jgi:hypothetical protein
MAQMRHKTGHARSGAGRHHATLPISRAVTSRGMDFKSASVFRRQIRLAWIAAAAESPWIELRGRLTLNVLLSFAQFEREVTGERIRDKIAASKKKGMWMGGVPPLGYEARDGKLVIVDNEAEIVRSIFRRYAALGSIRSLKEELDAHGLTSKCWTSASGRLWGGKPFARGALYLMLQNRIYRQTRERCDG